jgi:hypothetical protein
MTDIFLENDGDSWNVVFDPIAADIVLSHTQGRAVEVGQRSVWHFATWRGELFFDVTLGIPWADAVFGVGPIPGVAALLTYEAGTVDGVAEIESASYELDAAGRSLVIQIEQRPTDSDQASSFVLVVGG